MKNTTFIKQFALLVFFFCLKANCFSQIKLPENFHCVLGKNHMNESYFTNGDFIFRIYPWGHDGISGQDVVDIIEENYKHKIKFQKTKDNLFWATGEVDGRFLYIIIANGSIQITLSSETNNQEFSNYSTWLLSAIRENIKSKKGIYFTDSDGKGCSGVVK